MSAVTDHAAGTPSWVDLQSTDPAAARAFYAALFGWDYLIGGEELGYYAMASLGGKQVAGIGGLPPGVQMPSAWTVYLAVTDAAATGEAVQAHGGQVMMGPMEVPGQGRLVVFADPTGAVCGAWEPLAHRGAELVDEPGAMTWHEVATRDAAGARDFYSTVFGGSSRTMEGMEYHIVSVGDQNAYGVMQMDEQWGDIPPHWMVYFVVGEMEASLAKVAELGGAVRVPPFDTPYGRISVVSDPTGAVFSVLQVPAGSQA